MPEHYVHYTTITRHRVKVLAPTPFQAFLVVAGGVSKDDKDVRILDDEETDTCVENGCYDVDTVGKDGFETFYT